MMTEAQARTLIEQHRFNLDAWREPDGRLVPEEPDPAKRESTRVALRAAIETLERVLAEPAARRVSVHG